MAIDHGRSSTDDANTADRSISARRMRGQLTRLLNERLSHLEVGPVEPEIPTDDIGNVLLRDGLREQASDIHLDPQSDGFRVRMRIDGVLHDSMLLTREQGLRLLRHFKTSAGLDPVAAHRPVDARQTREVDGQELDIRLACAPCASGEKLSIRLLQRSRVEQHIDELGLSDAHLEQIRRWLGRMSGMFLVVGPTGSGKTTTLYALLHELKLLERSIITIEDPIEYQIDGITQMQVNEEHGLTFLEGLKAMMRLDPDYLLVGEVRDPPSAEAAIEAANSGRVLMSTLHTRDPIGTITSLRQWDVADHEISAALEVVISQRLVRKLCRKCRREGPPTAAEQRWLTAMSQPAPETTWHPVGCPACRHIGYAGRTGVFELWRLEEDDRDLIAEHTDEGTLRRLVAERKLPTLLEDGLGKAAAGVTSVSELVGSLGWSGAVRATGPDGD